MAQKCGSENKQYMLAEDKIIDTLFALLDDYTFEEITASQIIQNAGINRSTFYRHFQDKYAIVERVKEVALPYTMELMRISERGQENFVAFISNVSDLNRVFPEEHKDRFVKLSRIHTSGFDLRDFMCQGLKRQYILKNPNASDFECQIFADLMYSSIVYMMQGNEFLPDENMKEVIKHILQNM